MEIKDLTEWFPSTVKPNFIGVYEVKPHTSFQLEWLIAYSYWSGSGWLPGYKNVESAYHNRNTDPLSHWQNKQWRGLTRPIE